MVLEEGAAPDLVADLVPGPPFQRNAVRPAPPALHWKTSFYPILHGLLVAVLLAVVYGFFQAHEDAGIITGIFIGVFALFLNPGVAGSAVVDYDRAVKRIWSLIPAHAFSIGAYVSLMVFANWCPIMDRDAAVVHRAVYHPPTWNLSLAVSLNPSGLWVFDADAPDRAVFSVPPQSPNFIGFAINDSSTVFVMRLPSDDTPYPALPFPLEADGRLWLTTPPTDWRPSLFWIQQDLQTRPALARNVTSFLTQTGPLSAYNHSRAFCIPAFNAFLSFLALTYAWLAGLQLVILFVKVPCR